MEPDTGRILAMVSKPAYDPNQVQNQWDSLRTDSESRLLNRATQGVYPPGSTFKIITLLEFMREYPEEYRNFHYDCNGVLEQGDIPFSVTIRRLMAARIWRRHLPTPVTALLLP